MTDTILAGAPAATRRLLVLLTVCLAAAAMPLAFTGPAVALPAISQALGSSPVALNWVTNAFMLAFGSSLMASGSLADGYGRKRLFLVGVAGFALISLALAAAPDIIWFDLLRAAQGAAAAVAFSAGMASLAQEFDGASRLRAFSFVGTSFGIGLAFGPIAAGAMIEGFGWPAIFILVVALALMAFTLGAVVMRESRDPDARGLDWPGALSFTAALSLFTFGVLQAPESGWSDPFVIALLLAGAAIFALFCAIENRVARPMLDLSLFRYPRFVGVQLLAAAPAYAFVVLLILLPIRFIGIEGMTEIAAGRMMIALSAPLLVLPIASGLLVRWLKPSTICATGLVISAAGLLWLSFVPAGEASIAVLAPLAVIGTGISLPWGLMDGLAVSVVPTERAGMATGIFSTTRVAGEGVALAVVNAVLSGLTATALAAPDASPAAQRLVTGDLAGAAALLPQLDHAALIHGYAGAFALLLVLLAAITLLTALVIFLFLGKSGPT
ncbi:MFS transporter [Taklimakanibacter deserti]|uniref:MFS transporter n=1 Tax=Taklimakanibacter deserti TaxID=2267839 RepID=UPI000E64C031